MNQTLQIYIPAKQPDLEQSVLEFIEAEFQQTATFQSEQSCQVPLKDSGVLETLWQVAQFFAVVEGVLQLSERAQRLERVRKLHQAIQRAGKPVYLRIKGHSVDLYNKSVGQIMDILSGDKNGD